MTGPADQARQLLAMTKERWPIDSTHSRRGFPKDEIDLRMERYAEANVLATLAVGDQLQHLIELLTKKETDD